MEEGGPATVGPGEGLFMERASICLCMRIGAMNPSQSNVAAEVTRYTLSLSKGSDLFSDERVGIE